jgi:hypothetical protein
MRSWYRGKSEREGRERRAEERVREKDVEKEQRSE